MYEHHGCLASTGNEVKRGQYVPEPQGNVLHTRTPTPTPRSFSMTKISDILHLALEPKGHPSADMSVGSDTLKGTSSKRIKLQRDISPNDDRKTGQRNPTIGLRKGKRDRKLAVGLIERGLWIRPNLVPPEPPQFRRTTVPVNPCPPAERALPETSIGREVPRSRRTPTPCPERDVGKPAGPAPGHSELPYLPP